MAGHVLVMETLAPVNSGDRRLNPKTLNSRIRCCVPGNLDSELIQAGLFPELDRLLGDAALLFIQFCGILGKSYLHVL